MNWKKGSVRLLFGVVAPLVLAGLVVANTSKAPQNTPAGAADPQAKLMDKVRHELVMLPYYGVFDALGFQLKDTDTIVLTGEVTRPILKSDAEHVVQRVAGVGKVVNNIEVLPLSPMDSAIRRATYRAIFSKPGFEKYAIQAVSPIRIIVKNGNITLEGSVINTIDKVVAEMAARSIPGTFVVTNNLTIS